MPSRPLPFWFAYVRGVVFFFLVVIAIDWLAYFIWGEWLDWRAALAIATVLPGIGLMITWDEI